MAREAANTIKKQNEQIEFCRKQIEKVTQDFENSKIENQILSEKLKQLTNSPV